MSYPQAMLRPDVMPVRLVPLQAHEHADSRDGRWQTLADDVAFPHLSQAAGEWLLDERNGYVFLCPFGHKTKSLRVLQHTLEQDRSVRAR